MVYRIQCTKKEMPDLHCMGYERTRCGSVGEY